MSLIGRYNQTETAEELLDRLQNTYDVEVETGRNAATSIAYSANGLILRQKETVTTTEYRGLTKEAAQKLEELDRDTTTTATYYKQIGTSSEYAAVGIVTGSATDYVPSRADEGDGWICVKTVKEYAAAEAGGWTTTRPSGATSTPIPVSHDSRQSYVWEYGGDAIYATESVTVEEYRLLTKAEADALVEANTTNGVTLRKYVHGTAWSWNQTGTDKTASARYVDASNGYTVTVTTRVLGATGAGWTVQE